ncbi:hypothetical protein AB1Y20_007897 [Prymnesium parvum]|uniref:NB-ARC domain-containing protein n=1 Tax=Prymnesium parvum TaxID=97485 RepID=A0AB34IW95_PRYPA
MITYPQPLLASNNGSLPRPLLPMAQGVTPRAVEASDDHASGSNQPPEKRASPSAFDSTLQPSLSPSSLATLLSTANKAFDSASPITVRATALAALYLLHRTAPKSLRLPLQLAMGASALSVCVSAASGQASTPPEAQRERSSPPPTEKTYCAFVSHSKGEAATEARFLQVELERRLGDRVFIDSDYLRNQANLEQHVAESRCLILIQSKNVLTRPCVLVELMTAIKLGVPIVAVHFTGGAYMYDFAHAAEFLTRIDTMLPKADRQLLERRGFDMEDVAHQLSSTIPSVPSHKLDRAFSRAVLDAVFDELTQSVRNVAPPKPLDDKAEWLSKRGSPKEHRKLLRQMAHATPHGESASPHGTHSAPSAYPPPLAPMVPAHVSFHHSSRKALSNKLKAHLLTSASDGMRAVALRGGGGTGKSALASVIVRDAEVLSSFSAVAWASVGDECDVPHAKRMLLSQLVEKQLPPEAISEDQLDRALRDATRGRAVLLVLDDVWHSAVAKALCVVDPLTHSAVLLTTRVKGVLKEAVEVEVGVMDEDEAVLLLLRAGDMGHLTHAPPAEARKVAALCGYLPLALCIAGEVLMEHADDWTDCLAEELAEHQLAELRLRAAPSLESSAAAAASLEERLVSRTLRAITRAGAPPQVHDVLELCAAFARGVAVPAHVVDVAAASTHPSSGRLVRRCLKLLVDHSLVQGSIALGVSLHDIVRAYALARAAEAEGGMRAMQRRVLRALLEALSVEHAAGAGGRTELSKYAQLQLAHHVRGARDGGAPLREDALLVDALLGHADESVRRLVAEGVGEEAVVRAAEASEARGELEAAAGFRSLASWMA